MKKINYWLFSIFFLAIFLRLIFFDTSYFFWDETVYIQNAQFIMTGDAPYVQLYERPPLISLLLIPFYKSEPAVRIAMVTLNSLSIFSIYFLTKNFNKRAAMISALLLAIFPFHIMASRWIMTDTLSLLFITLSIGFYIYGIRKHLLWSYCLGGASLSLSILTKFTNLLLLPLLLFLFLIIKPDYRKLAYSIFISFLIFLPYLVFNQFYFGNTLYPIAQATHVIQEIQSVPITLMLWQILLFFGIISLFTLLGILLSKKQKRLNYYMIFWLIFTLTYFIVISQKGIPKMPGIEWEIQRFLFPALAPGLVIASRYLETLNKKNLILALLIIILFFLPSYKLAFTPMIEFEDGLRHVSKEIGIYARENLEADSGLLVEFNYPVIAYYSGKKTSNFADDLEVKQAIYSVKIEKRSIPLGDNVIHHVEEGSYRAKIIPFSLS